MIKSLCNFAFQSTFIFAKMETNSQPYNDLLEIRRMMERSSKFLSLSGLSGIFAGCCALAGAAYVYWGILADPLSKFNTYSLGENQPELIDVRTNILITAILVLVVALGGALYFSVRKAQKNKLKFWNKTTRQMMLHLFIPLVAGGLFSLMLFWQYNIQLMASATLVFYGLALVNAGKFTFGEIHYLGLSEIVLGLFAGIFINYGLLFWTIGFGVLHIVYGMFMYLKYER